MNTRSYVAVSIEASKKMSAHSDNHHSNMISPSVYIALGQECV